MSQSRTLEGEAHQFADLLTATVRGTVGSDCSAFRATGANERVSVRQDPDTGIPLRVAGEPLLTLKVAFECAWDSAGHFLAVQESAIKVFAGSKASGEPLFRYEYERGKSGDAPKAHIQVHAHRDALTFVMTLSGRSTAAGKQRAYKVDQSQIPTMSQLHFPVGGDRFRPALEDVLEMLIRELGVDHEQDWRVQLQAGRRTWRTIQTRAVVRDSPVVAAEVLERLGYTISPPETGHPDGNPQRLVDL